MTNEDKQTMADAISTKMRSIADECDENLQFEYDVYKLALAALTTKPVACKKRLVNHRTGAEYNWTYHGNVEEERSGDTFRVEVVPLFTNPTDYEVQE